MANAANPEAEAPRPMLEGMAMARAADAVPLATGENSYRVAVTVSIEIAQ